MIIKASASITLTRVDDGDDGKGIKSIVNKYLASSSGSNVTTATSGWTNTIQTITTSKRYLWNYEVITYTDNSTTTTTPVIIGVYGNTGSTGATGNGISSITEYYLVSPNKSGVTTSTSGWSTTIPTMTTTNKYLWNYEVIKYTNSTTSTGTPKVIGIYGDKGDKGDKGETGVGISSVDVEYYLSTSSTAQSGGSWSTTAPTWANGKYMWSRTKTVTTAGKTTYSNPVCITGGKGNTGATGATGATGKGVSSITEEYYLSTSKTTQTGGSWVTTPPTWSSGKYMWTRSKIVYTNPASTVYTAPVCDSSWEAVNEIQIGGRNLMVNSKETYTFTAFTGGTNKTMFYRTVTLPPDIKEGDKITVSLNYKYKNIVLVSGQESNARIYVQGSGNVTGWSPGFTGSANIVPSITKGSASELTYYQTYTFTLSAKQVTNKTFSVGLRTDYIASGSLSVYEMKVEKGNKPTDWTPAPEDVDGSISSLTERVSRAEQKITDSAIISTVQSTINAAKNEAISSANTNTANQLKNYATKSSLTQTADSITAKFSASGGYNLIRNSSGYNGTNLWTKSAGTMGTATNNNIGGAASIYMYLDNGTTTSETYAYSRRFKLKANTKYTLSGWFHNYTKCPSFDVFVLASNAVGETDKGTSYTAAYQLISKGNTSGAWKKYSVSFTTGTRIISGYVRIDNNGYNSAGSNSNRIHWSALMLNEGEEQPWTPHPSEVYDGSTIIDASGVTIKNGAIKIQNNSGQTVLSGDANGNLKMSGSVVVNTQNSQQLFVKTNDDKLPVLVGQSKGVFCSNLAVSNDYVEWSSDRAWSGTSISPTGISTGSLNTSGSTSINGSLTYKGHTILNGSDTWLRTYGESGWYNGTYGGGWFMADSSWLRAYGDKGVYSGGNIETGSNMRCGDVLYFTRSETGYWLKARWSYNRFSIEAPNFTGNGLLSNDKIYLRSNSPYGGMILDTGGYFYPEQNNGVSIGHPNGYRISTLYYTNLSAASDLKLKENISYINTSDNQTMSVDEVINTKDFYTFVKDELRLATFDYKTVDKDEQSNRGKIGFIAQDISETKVGKHLLKKDEIKQIDLVDVDKMILDEGETVLSYDLTDYVNVLAGALQEATKKIDLLENENMELKERLSKLENLVNQIISK